MEWSRWARRWGGTVMWKRHVWMQRRKYPSAALDPERLVRIEPVTLMWFYGHDVISEAAQCGTNLRLSIGTVAGGDWDLSPIPIRTLRVFDAIHARVNGAEWGDTQLPGVVAKRPAFAQLGPEAVKRYLNRIDKMITIIRNDGYRSQRDVGSGRPWDEVLVAVDRVGQIRFVDGRHRLAIAQALEIPSIPVLVTTRHQDWVDTILSGAARDASPSVTPIHPDLQVEP